MATYSYAKATSRPDSGWDISRDDVPILALPPELPELVVGAVTRTLEHEVIFMRCRA
jgi:hypothetical protein